MEAASIRLLFCQLMIHLKCSKDFSLQISRHLWLRIHVDSEFPASIGHSMNNLLHYICVSEKERYKITITGHTEWYLKCCAECVRVSVAYSIHQPSLCHPNAPSHPIRQAHVMPYELNLKTDALGKQNAQKSAWINGNTQTYKTQRKQSQELTEKTNTQCMDEQSSHVNDQR